MKKLLSVVLALVMVLSLSVVAFASVDNDTDKTYTLDLGGLVIVEADPDKPGNTYHFTILVEYDMSAYAVTDDFYKAVLDYYWKQWGAGVDVSKYYDSTTGDLIAAVKAGTLDIPYFLTDDDIAKHLTVSVKENDAKVVDTASIVKKNGVYKVKIVTKETYTTSTYGIDWTITLKKNKTKVVSSTEVLFREKWASVTAEEDKDGDLYYEVDLPKTDGGAMFAGKYASDANVRALVALAKNQYNEVHFGETGFWYSVKMLNNQTINAYWTNEFKKLFQFFDDADVEGVFLKGTPNVDAKGTFHASFDDDMFVYAVTSADGKLEDLFKWNKDNECWEYNTRAIYGAIVSDTKLDIEAWNKTLTGDASSTTESKGNPGTGSVDFVNLAVALGVVSLAAAGAVVLKRK